MKHSVYHELMVDSSGIKAILYNPQNGDFRVGNSKSNELEYVSSDSHNSIMSAIAQLYQMGYRIDGLSLNWRLWRDLD